MSKMQKLKSSILVAIFLATTLFFFSPLDAYFSNLPEFPITTIPTVIISIIVSVFFTIIILTPLLFLGDKTLQKAQTLIFIVGVLLWVQKYFLPSPSTQLSGEPIDWSHFFPYIYRDIAIWVIVITFALIKPKLFEKIIIPVSIILVITQTTSLGYTAFLSPKQPSYKSYTINETNKYNFSKTQNVIIIVLDTFQSDIFQEIIDKDPSYKTSFDGFTYFINTSSAFPYTETSLSSMLTSTPYDKSVLFRDYKEKAYFSDHSILRTLKDHGFLTEVYTPAPRIFFFSPAIISNIETKQLNISEWLPVIQESLFEQSPSFIKWLFLETYNFDPATEKELYAKFKTSPAVTTSTPVFKFYHLNGPHWPLQMDENFNRTDGTISRENYKNQAKAYLKIVDNFLLKLKKLGIYDNSTILIMGDHGAGFQKQKFILPPSWPVQNPNDIITDPYQFTAIPLLLAKPNNSTGTLKISEKPVSLLDIPKTIFSLLNIDKQAQSKEISIFDNEDKFNNRKRYFFLYGFADDSRYNNYSDITEYEINGLVWENSSWTKSPTTFTKKGPIVNSILPIPYPISIDFGQSGNSNNFKLSGWSETENTSTWIDKNTATLLIPVTPPSQDLALELDIYPFTSPPSLSKQIIDIYVNKNKLTENFSIEKEGKYIFTIPKSFTTNNLLRIDFFTSTGKSPRELGLGQDKRTLSIALKSLTLKEK